MFNFPIIEKLKKSAFRGKRTALPLQLSLAGLALCFFSLSPASSFAQIKILSPSASTSEVVIIVHDSSGWLRAGSVTHTTPSTLKAGIGLSLPVSNLHVHQAATYTSAAGLRLTTTNTGSALTDGFQLFFDSSSNLSFSNLEALGTIIFNTTETGLTIAANGGLLAGAPTGGSQGVGTLNSTGLYINGVAVGVGAGGIGWQDDGTNVRLIATTDEVVVGGTTPLESAKVTIDGDADQTQLIIQGNSTQNTQNFIIETSTGVDKFSVANDGAVIAAGLITANAGADVKSALYVSGTMNLDTVRTNLGVGTATFAVSKTYYLIVADAGGNTITSITGGGSPGAYLVLRFNSALVTIPDNNTGSSNTVNLNDDFKSSNGAILSLVYNGTNWNEVSRSTTVSKSNFIEFLGTTLSGATDSTAYDVPSKQFATSDSAFFDFSVSKDFASLDSVVAYTTTPSTAGDSMALSIRVKKIALAGSVSAAYNAATIDTVDMGGGATLIKFKWTSFGTLTSGVGELVGVVKRTTCTSNMTRKGLIRRVIFYGVGLR